MYIYIKCVYACVCMPALSPASSHKSFSGSNDNAFSIWNILLLYIEAVLNNIIYIYVYTRIMCIYTNIHTHNIHSI